MVEKCGKLKLWQNITKVVDPDKPSAARLHVSWKKYKKYPNILEPNVPVLADFCCMQPNQIMLAKMVGPAKNIPHQLGSNVQVNRFGKIAINSRYLQPRKCTVYWTHIAPWIAWQVAVSLRSRPSSSTSPLDAFRHLCERTEQTWCVCLPKGGASGWTHAEMCCNAHGKYLHMIGVPNMKIMKPKREGKHSKHRAKKSSKIKIRCIEVNTASTAHWTT